LGVLDWVPITPPPERRRDRTRGRSRPATGVGSR
jgi:hypothetical protein